MCNCNAVIMVGGKMVTQHSDFCEDKLHNYGCCAHLYPIDWTAKPGKKKKKKHRPTKP